MSNKKYGNGLFIFHRDLRIVDNVGLLHAHSQCSQLYTCFIFTPEQIGPSNTYRSLNAVAFMLECLEDLSHSIRQQGGTLLFLYGDSAKVVKQLISELQLDAVFFNEDYTPYAVARDARIAEVCKASNIETGSMADYYLQRPGAIYSAASRTAYKKFTPFYEAVVSKSVEKPARNINLKQLVSIRPNRINSHVSLDTMRKKIGFSKVSNRRVVVGGRANGVRLLINSVKIQAHYEKTRDYVALPTSKLSAHIKFGTVSIREVYHAFSAKYGGRCEFIRQLYWRDFFAHLLFAYPESIRGANYTNVRWTTSKKWVDLWKSGQTGFPIIDAGMRELEQTGYMHNRCRLIVANFFVKTLGLDWRIGEKHFAAHLTDYDVASNNGNWQNISSTGVYNQPYFRDVNPWIQGKKLDADCEYIKRWVPELANVENRVIHRWFDLYDQPENKGIYLKPMVDYREQKAEVLELYKK